MAHGDPLSTLDQDALAHDESSRARVRLKGPDARAFLHRMSTNHVAELEAGAARLNALVTDKGRFVDVVHHLDLGDDGVLLVGSSGRGEALHAWLDRYIFTEKIDLALEPGRTMLVFGAAAPARVGGEDLPPWGMRRRDGAIVVRTFDRVDAAGNAVPAYLVLDGDVAATALVDDVTAEAVRVAAGVPGDVEISDAYNPLDLGLHDALHWAKGCYIGQEVIARLDTYQKQSRRVFGLVGDPSRLRVGDAVSAAGATIGVVTSVAPRAFGKNPAALAVLKLSEPGVVVVNDTQFTARLPATAQTAHD